MRTTAEPWQLVQYLDGAGDAPRVGVLTGERIRRGPAWFPDSVLAILGSWAHLEGKLRELEPDLLAPVFGATLCAPILYPRKVICAGINFNSHIREMGAVPPPPGSAPFFFLKPPTTTVVGPDAVCPLPPGEGANYDWEAELAIVIGARAKGVSAADARSVVAGYTIANDLSARGRFARRGSAAPFDWDWLGQKAQDASCPIGPGIVPAWLTPQIDASRMRLAVNGEVMQDETLSDLIVGIDLLVAGASAVMTLEPGDLILTGTPAGVGHPREQYLAPGDVVEVSIDTLGTLRHSVGPALSGPWTPNSA